MNKVYYERFIIFLENVKEKHNISDKKIKFFKDYYGVDITKSLSLQEIGDNDNITKERVRQSIEDVRKYCRQYIENEGIWFKENLNNLNNIIYKKLPSEKERLIYSLFEETHCSRWVLFQEEIFGVDSQLLYSKNKGATFIFKKGYQSIKLSPFKEKQALSYGYKIDKNRIIDLSKIKDKDLLFLYEKDFIKSIDLVPILLSQIRKDIIKNGTLHIDSFIKYKWNEIELFSTIGRTTKKNKIDFIILKIYLVNYTMDKIYNNLIIYVDYINTKLALCDSETIKIRN